MNFSYSDRVKPDILDIKLIDLMCNHVLNMDSDVSKEAYKASIKFDSSYFWGDSEDYHLRKVKELERDFIFEPVGVFLLKYDGINDVKYYWVDDLHMIIRYIRLYGTSVRLRDVPFYVIDLSGSGTLVFSKCNTSHTTLKDVEESIESAMTRLGRSYSDELLRCNYLVKDFLHDNPRFLSEV